MSNCNDSSDVIATSRKARRLGRVAVAILAGLGLFAGLLVSGCREAGERAAESPASGVMLAGEVRLSVEQQAAVGLRTTKVERRRVRATRAVVGWAIVKPGLETIVRAPTTGCLTLPAQASDVAPGAVVTPGQPLGAIEAVLSPAEQASMVAAKEEADTIIHQSQVSLEIARGQLERLRKSEGATAGLRLLELEELIRKAEIAGREAHERLPFLPSEPYGSAAGLRPLVLSAPQAGRIVQVHASARQVVLAGDPLYTLADWSTLWLRVPLLLSEPAILRADEVVQVRVPGGELRLPARPLDIPQPVVNNERLVDVLLELANPGGKLRPGQAVTVELPTHAETEQLVVPRSALVFDGLGSVWVYVAEGDDEFRRQRVETGSVVGDEVVIQRGLADGVPVVSIGAQTLYGEEFKGSLQAAAKDDDD